jgi:alpha-ribazole phosphatase
MKNFYIIRHGQSLANTGAKSMPEFDIPLTELGNQQANNVLSFWRNHLARPSCIYHSQMLRTKQTAQFFSDYFDISPKELSLLNEFRCLSYSTVANMMGEQRSKIAQHYWQTADIHHLDGDDADSFVDFLTRIDEFIAKIPEFENNSVFFGHGLWVGLLAWRLLGCDITNNVDMQKFRQFQMALPMYNTVVYHLTLSDENILQLKLIKT